MSKIRQREYDYDPVLFLRCHSKTDRDYADVKTQVWQACFEPSSKSKIVATCGGNQVCLIDVKCQEVEQRYTADSREIFYSLAWGTLETAGLKLQHQDVPETVTILAAAGVRNTIYFIYPSKKVVLTHYTLKVSKAHISYLLFHPKHSNVLICSTSAGEVYILRLNIDDELMLRVKETNKLVSTSEIFVTTFYKRSDTLLAATDVGLIGWLLNDYEEEMMDNELIKFRLPVNPNNVESEGFDLVDSVEIVKNHLIAVKCALHGYIYICSLTGIRSKCRESQIIDLVPVYLLNWSPTDNYFMGISVNYEKGLLSCGDDKGAIWLYDLNEIKKNDLPDEPKNLDPVKIIEWPSVEDKSLAKSRKLNLEVYDIVIAKATIHAKGKYIVAITNNNTVCIWKLTSKH